LGKEKRDNTTANGIGKTETYESANETGGNRKSKPLGDEIMQGKDGRIAQREVGAKNEVFRDRRKDKLQQNLEREGYQRRAEEFLALNTKKNISRTLQGREGIVGGKAVK